jgi:hypothetical protein
VPLGASKANFNYSVDQKRVLNMENIVNDADNIKQVNLGHLHICMVASQICTPDAVWVTHHIKCICCVCRICRLMFTVGRRMMPLSRRRPAAAMGCDI